MLDVALSAMMLLFTMSATMVMLAFVLVMVNDMSGDRIRDGIVRFFDERLR